ncbi:MAG: hypothetical protein DLM53_08025 [Candidatus Eremiobacter antarcticus]|nr:M23 family metallopeptidase [Candidatus Eremiobacteraeota bacterium]MBC5807297.1 M23 family metallopeptidase [Candidatus Eremiobacteraeota bacterium]PZR61743.1 MAG: hypothetical protein DLM53_08025 [Candidatus Eremiobacter sp. RRmetagenome_bin22]
MRIKVMPHDSQAVYKWEFSHYHLSLLCASFLVLILTLLGAHFAAVHQAQANVEALQVREAQQDRQLNVFSKQTSMLWDRLAKLQRDNQEMHRLTKVIAPQPKVRGSAKMKEANKGATQYGATSGPPSEGNSTVWSRAVSWMRNVSNIDSLGFQAEAADLSSLAAAVDSASDESTNLKQHIRVLAQQKIAARAAHERSLAAIPSMWPTLGYISSGFGYRSDPEVGFHEGLDIVNDYGAPVYATAAGVVTESGWDGGYGNKIAIDHGNGLQTWYAHNSRLLVAAGQTVRKGQQIALVGSTGFATGPHVHYQLEMWGKAIDPTPFLTAGAKVIAAH